MRKVRTIKQVKVDNSNNHIYSDINLRQDPKTLVVDADSINQNITMILGVRKKTWWWGPEKGSFLSQYLFDPIDNITANKIKTEMINALTENGENRIVFKKINVIPDIENQQYYCEIYYDVPFLRLKGINFSFNLSRAFQ